MGANNGTGQPNWFRCAKCRSTLRGGKGGWVGDAELTGRKRRHKGKVGARITHIDREYRCAACGHVGWSAHVDLADKAGDHRYLLIDSHGREYLPSYEYVAR